MTDAPSDALQHAMARLYEAVGREVSLEIGYADGMSGVAAIDNPPNESDLGVKYPDFDDSRGSGRVEPTRDLASITSSESASDHWSTAGVGEGEGNEGNEDRDALQSESSMSPRGLARSLVDRLGAHVEFTPFGGSPIKEQEALEPAPMSYMHFPAVGSRTRFDAAFMLPETRKSRRKQTSSVPTRRSCNFCIAERKRCDGNIPCAMCKKTRRECVRSVPEAGKKRKACDLCRRKRRRCDGKKRCSSCKTNRTKCVRSAPMKRKGASRSLGVLPGRDTSGLANLEGSQLRCRHVGCLQLPQHGRQGGRALWCTLHSVSQNANQPKGCPVLQQSASGEVLTCSRATTWGLPGQPPTRCERHKAEGHQQQNLDAPVSLLKGVFAEVVWPRLLERGWQLEGRYFLPPHVVRGVKDFKARVDYFDSQRMAIAYCLRSEEHHEWMMEECQKLTAKAKVALPQTRTASIVREPSSCVHHRRIAGLPVDPKPSMEAAQASRGMLVPDGGSHLDGVPSTQSAKCSQQKRKETFQQPPPTKGRAFSHELFSITPSSKQTKLDRNRAGDGSRDSPPKSCEIRPSRTEARSTERRSSQLTHTPIPADEPRQGDQIMYEGQETATVMRGGLPSSEQILAGYMARRSGGDDSAVSLGATVSGSEDFIASQPPQDELVQQTVERGELERGQVMPPSRQDGCSNALDRISNDRTEALSRGRLPSPCDISAFVH